MSFKNEYINYSKYKANDSIPINKYIGEQESGIVNLLAGAIGGSIQLLIAPTGSGKTNSTINILKRYKIKSIFIVPNATNVEQIMNEYDIPGAYGDLSAEDQLSKGDVVVMTWDKFEQIKNIDLSEYIAVVDEIHQTFTDMYREKKIKGLYNNLSKCKGRIDITATPNKLDFNIYEFICEYKQNTQTKYNVKLYNKLNDNEIIKIINKSNKSALLKDDTAYLEYIKNSINKNSDIITSSSKDSNATYFEIANNSSMKNVDVLLNTSVIVAGVNINEPNITDIIVIGIKDIATIKQYVARFRNLDEVNVHIFNSNYNQDISNTYEIEWLVNERFKEINEDIEHYNRKNKREFITQKLGLKMIRLEGSNEYYYDNETREYKVNMPGIRNACYMNYYRNADILSFKELLMEYFDNVEVIQIDEAKNEDRELFNKFLKQTKREALELLENDLDILVGVNELIRGKVNSNLDRYFKENKLDKDKILQQINDNNIPELIKVGNIKKVLDLYTKYIVENNFNYELSWYVANLGNRARGKFFDQLNIQVARKVQKKYPELIDDEIIENRIYNLLVYYFKPGISYTKEHVDNFLEGLKITSPNLKITEKEIREKLVNIYVIDTKQVRNVPTVGYIYYNNMLPTPGTKLNIYTIKAYKKIADIADEHQLSEISCKCLNNIIKKRYNNIINSEEAQDIINISDIFVS